MPDWIDEPLPAERHCAMFDTAIGPCGLAWRDEALTAVVLPLADREATLEELRWTSSAELLPPPWPAFVGTAVAGMQALLRGEAPQGLETIELDWAGIGSFERRVYEAARLVPHRAVTTCGELAARVEAPGEERAVDVALARNPWPLVVPSHRVLPLRDEQDTLPATGGAAVNRRLRGIEAGAAPGNAR
ncbi:MAG: methylated-DNA--[protein]-cysteine S-methyltransferase [Rubrivivax sp.]|nr:methylated-DNA--[protein]-cysteine S-methyltransferase [Rubrivivax sp.]